MLSQSLRRIINLPPRGCSIEHPLFFCVVDVQGGLIYNVRREDISLKPTEAKLFEYFADLYEQKPFTSITMLSERGMCDSCKGVMEQFKKQFPNVTINVVSNKAGEGNVWKDREE